MVDFINLLRREWGIISSNAWTFVFFSCSVAFITWKIHDYVTDIKLHHIPEREKLQKEISQLKTKISELEKTLHKQNVRNLIHEVKQGTETKSIGKIISKRK